MKIMKLVLTSLLGAVVLGGAIADEYDGPRNRCLAKEKKGIKVWVEPKKDCVDVNPCFYVKKYIQGDWAVFFTPNSPYCFANFYQDDERLRKKYIQEVRGGVGVKSVSEVPNDKEQGKLFGYRFSDGNYLVFMVGNETLIESPDKQSISDDAFSVADTCYAYGYDAEYDSRKFNANVYCKNVESDNKCAEIASFAKDILNKDCSGNMKGSNCFITCGGSTQMTSL